jgi:hypothetical protein
LKPDPANRSKVIRVLQDMFEVVTQDMLSDEARCVALSAFNSLASHVISLLCELTRSLQLSEITASSRELSAVPGLFMLHP